MTTSAVDVRWGRTGRAFLADGVAAVAVAAVALPLTLGASPVRAVFSVAVAELLAVPIALVVARWPLRRLVRHLGIPRAAVRGIVFVYLGTLTLDASLLTFESPSVAATALDQLLAATNALDWALVAAIVVVLAPLVEEILMRGIVLRAVAINWGPIAGVVISAAIFALLHLNWGQGKFALVSGVILALALLRTGALGVTVVLHALGNATALAAIGVLVWLGVQEDAASGDPSRLTLTLGTIGALVGSGLVVRGLRRLPSDPRRLAELWGVPEELASPSVAELCRRARALSAAPPRPVLPERSPAASTIEPATSVPARVRCASCGETMNADLPRCWFCNTPLAAGC